MRCKITPRGSNSSVLESKDLKKGERHYILPKDFMKRTMKFLKIMMLSLLCIIALGSVRVEAAEVPGKVTGIIQTDSRSTSIDIQWTAPGFGLRYESYISTDNVNWTLYHDCSSNDDFIYGLNAGTSYYVKVRAYTKSWNSDTYSYDYTYGAFSDVIECVTSPDSTITNFKKTASTTKTVSISWTGADGASGYLVKYYNDYKDEPNEVYVTGCSVKLSNLEKDSEYKISVTPYKATANGAYVALSSAYPTTYYAKVTPSKVTGVEAEVSTYSKSMSIECNYDKQNADGYQFQVYRADGKGKKILTETKEGSGYVSVKNKNFAKFYMFKVRVRAYVDDSGKKAYGSWSSWKYVSRELEITNLKSTKKGIKLTWDELKGADRYVIYASTKQKSGYKKVKTINKGATTSCTISKIAKKKLKKGKTYYFYVVPYEKVKGKYYQSVEPKYCYKIKYTK